MKHNYDLGVIHLGGGLSKHLYKEIPSVLSQDIQEHPFFAGPAGWFSVDVLVDSHGSSLLQASIGTALPVNRCLRLGCRTEGRSRLQLGFSGDVGPGSWAVMVPSHSLWFRFHPQGLEKLPGWMGNTARCWKTRLSRTRQRVIDGWSNYGTLTAQMTTDRLLQMSCWIMLICVDVSTNLCSRRLHLHLLLLLLLSLCNYELLFVCFSVLIVLISK